MTFQEKDRSRFENAKSNISDREAMFLSSHGWFRRFEARANFRHVKFGTEAANEDLKETESCP
jgi:hypothetical protein